MPQLTDFGDDLPAVPTTPALPQWQERTLVFRGNDAPTGTCPIETVDARVYGRLAVHDTLPGNAGCKPVTITHLPSMVVVCREHDEALAEVRVEWLWGQCPTAWSGDAVDKAKLPPEVVAWCKENQR